MKKHTSRVAFVTGASSGIGYETVRELCRKGYIVYGGARRKEKLLEIEKFGAIPLWLDVTKENSCARAVEIIIREQGRLDLLVNNAGFGIYGTVEDVPIGEAVRQMDVNLFGMARMIQLVLPHMRRLGSGKIVNISSVAGKMSMPLGCWYHASKHAVEALSDSLRAEVEPFGIEVVIIEPGIIATPWWSIARKNLMNISTRTRYPELVIKGIGYLDNPGRASHPSLVAKTIVKAAAEKKPRTRYSVGSGASMILWARCKLSDRKFDSILLKRLGL